MYVRLQWWEMRGGNLPHKDPASVVKDIAGVLVTDGRSLYDVVKRGNLNPSGLGLKEKYSVPDMVAVLQRLEKRQTTVRWVHSEIQLADSLTKHVTNSLLTKVLIEGKWRLTFDPNFSSSKKLRQAKRQRSAVTVGACDMSCILEAEQSPLVILPR